VIVVKTDEEPFSISKPRPWLRWLKRLGKGLLVVILAIVVRQVWHHYEANKKLQETLAELDRTDPGWRLEDIEAAREQIPKEENSARVVVAAGKLLPSNWPPKEFSELFTHLAPEEQLSPEDFARLRQELENVRPAVDEARKLAKMPRGRHHIVYERNPLETRLNDQAEARRIAMLLAFDALRYNQNGDGTNALTSCRAVLNAARSLGDEPITISQLIRNACVLSGCQAMERTLAQSEAAVNELMALQRSLEIEDSHPDLLIIMRGERAMCHAVFNAVENGDVSLDRLADAKWSWLDHALISIVRMDTREDHILMLSLMKCAIANARLPMHEQREAEAQLDQEIKAARDLSRRPLLTGLLMPPMTKRGESSRRTHASIRCMTVALAAERYRRERGAWPDMIEKLCPKYLTAPPLDPFDGQPLRYHRLDDGVVIYSVGPDTIDDGGDLDPEHPNQPGVDIGVRLWDAAKRRQPPREKPPPPQEIGELGKSLSPNPK
jgi:hypothetical protein